MIKIERIIQGGDRSIQVVRIINPPQARKEGLPSQVHIVMNIEPEQWDSELGCLATAVALRALKAKKTTCFFPTHISPEGHLVLRVEGEREPKTIRGHVESLIRRGREIIKR